MLLYTKGDAKTVSTVERQMSMSKKQGVLIMTKVEMIIVLKNKEAEAWATLQLYERNFGREDELTKHARTEWSTIFELCHDLGVSV